MVASIESATSISIDPITLNSEELLSVPEGLETPSPRRDLEKQQRRINAIFGRQLAAHRSQASQLQMHHTKGKIKKWWKKHKKKVLIGAVLVAAATLTIVTGGNGAPAAGAAVSGVAGSKKKKKKRPPVNKPGQVGMPPPASIAKPRSSRPIAQTISQPKSLVSNTLKIPQSTPALKPFQISDIIPKALSAQQTPPKNWKLPMKLPNPSSKQSTSQSPKIVSNLPHQPSLFPAIQSIVSPSLPPSNWKPPKASMTHKPSISKLPLPELKLQPSKSTVRKTPSVKEPQPSLEKPLELSDIMTKALSAEQTLTKNSKISNPFPENLNKKATELKNLSPQPISSKTSRPIGYFPMPNGRPIPIGPESDVKALTAFDRGLLKGLGKGAWASGKGTAIFMKELAAHPIDTPVKLSKALYAIGVLAKEGEWAEIRKTLSPELDKLVTQWETLSDEERGELTGKVVGELGTDFLIVKGTGIAGKVVTKTVKNLNKGTPLVKNAGKISKSTPSKKVINIEKLAVEQIAKEKAFLETVNQPALRNGIVNESTLEKIRNSISKINPKQLKYLETSVSEWLGDGTRLIRNKAGDPVFLSKDATRRVRFDFNKTYPHENPHLHFEKIVDGKWENLGRVYPSDVPHK